MPSIAKILSKQGINAYAGDSFERPNTVPLQAQNLPYLPSEELVNAVNLSIFLEKRPLLLKGEPGCGKTRLAEAIALELGLPYEAWYIKSTTRARDGLYTYDAVGRLHDAQLSQRVGTGTLSSEDLEKKYIKMGPLGKAFENDRSTVVLIDEIDKADLDFPNDLLREIDEQKFTIDETQREVNTKFPPIIIITSNDEKELPDAFLRRCLFFYIEFPSVERLNDIVAGHFPQAPSELIKTAVQRFYELRGQLRKTKAAKNVSTSELLDWFSVLNQLPNDEAFESLRGKIPFREVLLKKWEDHQGYLKYES